MGNIISLSRATVPGESRLAGFTEAKDDGGGGENWSYKTCKAQVKSSPPTNHHPTFLQVGSPSCHPINSVKAHKSSTALCQRTEGNVKGNIIKAKTDSCDQ